MPKTVTPVPVDGDALWLDEDVANFLRNVSLKTLANWRSARTGPPFLKVGTGVRYRPAAVQQWAKDRERNITPQKAA